MNRLTLIALLLAAVATSMVGGFESHKRRSQHRLAKRGGLDAEEVTDSYINCIDEYEVSDADSEKFVRSIGGPMEMDIPLLECISGCFFQSLTVIVDNAFNKEFYAFVQCDENNCKAADHCGSVIDDVPKDMCSQGGAILQQCNVTNFRMFPEP